MKKFEYMQHTGTSLTVDRLNLLGLEGWELVLYNGHRVMYIFKREV